MARVIVHDAASHSASSRTAYTSMQAAQPSVYVCICNAPGHRASLLLRLHPGDSGEILPEAARATFQVSRYLLAEYHCIPPRCPRTAPLHRVAHGVRIQPSVVLALGGRPSCTHTHSARGGEGKKQTAQLGAARPRSPSSACGCGPPRIAGAHGLHMYDITSAATPCVVDICMIARQAAGDSGWLLLVALDGRRRTCAAFDRFYAEVSA